MVIHIRDYIIFILGYINTLRASNVINITLQEVLSAKRDKVIKEAFVFKNNKYKVSIIYGAKLILVSETVFHHIKLYIHYLRPILINVKHRLDRERYLFVSSKLDAAGAKAVQLQNTALGWCLIATCERSGIFQNIEEEAQKRTSTSQIRFSVITELVCLGEDSLDNIAYYFGKHTKKVCKKFYLQFWSNREAARLSWKVHQMCNSENDSKAIELREQILQNKKKP